MVFLKSIQPQTLQFSYTIRFILYFDLFFHSLLYRKLRFNCSWPKATAYDRHKDFPFFINFTLQSAKTYNLEDRSLPTSMNDFKLRVSKVSQQKLLTINIYHLNLVLFIMSLSVSNKWLTFFIKKKFQMLKIIPLLKWN